MEHVAVGLPAAASVRVPKAILGRRALLHLVHAMLVRSTALRTTAMPHAQNVASVRAALPVQAVVHVRKANTQTRQDPQSALAALKGHLQAQKAMPTALCVIQATLQ